MTITCPISLKESQLQRLHDTKGKKSISLMIEPHQINNTFHKHCLNFHLTKTQLEKLLHSKKNNKTCCLTLSKSQLEKHGKGFWDVVKSFVKTAGNAALEWGVPKLLSKITGSGFKKIEKNGKEKFVILPYEDGI